MCVPGNHKGVTIDGKHYTGYEATQMQRKLERAIRKRKARILVDETTGDEAKLLNDQIRLQRLQQEYSRFSKAAGLRTENERAQVAGFDRKQAARATSTAKKQIALIDAFSQRMAESGYITKGFDFYVGDAETLNQMQTAFTRLAQDFPEAAAGLTVQLSWSEDTYTFGWFDPKTKSIHYNRAIFKNWGSLQAEYANLAKSGHFPVGTDARGCFYHEFGHAVWSAKGLGSLRKSVDTTLSRMGYGYVNVSQRKAALAKELSMYSTADTKPAYQEVIAEAFNEWYTNSEPRKFCIEFLKEVGVL